MITVEVPATSANLGIGFDALGAALDWYSRFRFEESDILHIEGCPEEYRNADNLVVRAFAHVCKALQKEMPSFHLTIDSDIPLKRGLGSSAVCIASGVLAANSWFSSPLTKEQCLFLACELEGHPDNLAPAFYGGFQLSAFDGQKVEHYPLPAAELYAALLIPSYPVETEAARKILPAAIAHREASAQVFQALKFALALEKGEDAMLAEAIEDRLHEPYRATLIKDYAPLKELCGRAGLPLWISGSGSTLSVASFREEKLKRFIRDLQEERPDLEIRMCRFANRGAVIHE